MNYSNLSLFKKCPTRKLMASEFERWETLTSERKIHFMLNLCTLVLQKYIFQFYALYWNTFSLENEFIKAASDLIAKQNQKDNWL